MFFSLPAMTGYIWILERSDISVQTFQFVQSIKMTTDASDMRIIKVTEVTDQHCWCIHFAGAAISCVLAFKYL